MVARAGYTDICKRVQEPVTQELAYRLQTKVYDNLPAGYRTALELPSRIGSESSSLRETYARLQKEYNVHLSEVETVIRLSEKRLAVVANVNMKVRLPRNKSVTNAEVVESDLRKVSYREIGQARTAIQRLGSKAQEKMLTFLKTEDGRALTVQGLRAASDLVGSMAVARWVETWPILGPAKDVVSQTLRETVDAHIKKLNNQVVLAIAKNPENAEAIVQAEVSKVVDQVSARIPPKALNGIQELIRQSEQRLEAIVMAKTVAIQQAEQMEDVRIGQLIEQLHAQSPDERANAIEELSQRGDRISQKRIDQLSELVKADDESWESHRGECGGTRYESVRGNAATVIHNIKDAIKTPQRIRPDVAREAEERRVETRTESSGGG